MIVYIGKEIAAKISSNEIIDLFDTGTRRAHLIFFHSVKHIFEYLYGFVINGILRLNIWWYLFTSMVVDFSPPSCPNPGYATDCIALEAVKSGIALAWLHAQLTGTQWPVLPFSCPIVVVLLKVSGPYEMR